MTNDSVFHRIDADTQPDGSIVAHHVTNDDNDDGWPDGNVEKWKTTYRNRASFDKCVGKSRIGISGIVVTVDLDGHRL